LIEKYFSKKEITMIEDRDWHKIGYGTNRLRVPGGWFIMLYTGGPSKSAFFYPDPNHTWDGSAMKEPAPEPEPVAAKAPVSEIPVTSEAASVAAAEPIPEPAPATA
jgi:hypothetical protein